MRAFLPCVFVVLAMLSGETAACAGTLPSLPPLDQSDNFDDGGAVPAPSSPSVAAARAEALPPLPSLDQAGNVDDGDSGANWYLRGGFGAILPGEPSVRPYFLPGATTRGEDLEAGWAVTGALGYQFGWLRGDVSLDYLGQRDFSERFSGICGTACSGTLKGRFSAVPILANLYYDIGTWNNVTPYLGAGAGIAHVDWNRIDLGGLCNGACPLASGAASWRFAWQVGAGVNYALTDRLSVDVDYRLLDLGSARAGSPPVGNIAARTIWDNELRIGLRYRLN